MKALRAEGLFLLSELTYKGLAVKAFDENAGTLDAIISTFGVKDRDGDIMLASAFASSSAKAIPMVWCHDWDKPVGKGIVEITPTEAIYHGQFFLDTEKGLEAWKTVKNMAELQEYSIGFRIIDASDEKTGDGWVRTIRDIELFEASPVLVGAAIGTRTLDVKAHAEHADIAACVAGIERYAKSLAADTKAGRMLSQANIDKLKAALDAIENAAETIEDILGIAEPDEPSGDEGKAMTDAQLAVFDVDLMLAKAREGVA